MRETNANKSTSCRFCTSGYEARRRPLPERLDPGRLGGQDESRPYAEVVGSQPRSFVATRVCRGDFLRPLLLTLCSRSRCDLWWVQPRPCINRPMWSRWYVTAKRCAITSAMREVVHTSVLNPFARAPLSNKRPSFRSCPRGAIRST